MGILIGHPFDSLKTRLQAGSLYAGKQGATKLYAGIWPPLLTAGTIQSINFSLYEWSKKQILDKNTNPILYQCFGQSYLQSVFWSGSIAGAAISIATTPISFMKVRQQLLLKETVVQIWKANPLSFYRAYPCMFWMESFGRGVYLHAYESSKQFLSHTLKSQSFNMGDRSYDFLVRALSASWAGCFSWFCVFPLDVIKTRLQLDFNGVKYKGTWDCGVKMYKEGGLPPFFRGLTFTLIRAAPVATSVLLTYDYTKSYLESYISSH